MSCLRRNKFSAASEVFGRKQSPRKVDHIGEDPQPAQAGAHHEWVPLLTFTPLKSQQPRAFQIPAKRFRRAQANNVMKRLLEKAANRGSVR
jgi:hypothetical protein